MNSHRTSIAKPTSEVPKAPKTYRELSAKRKDSSLFKSGKLIPPGSTKKEDEPAATRDIKKISVAYKTGIPPKPATTKNAEGTVIDLNRRMSKIRAKPDSAVKEAV